MTFGIGSPGFDPFHCPPCPDGHLCNVMCFDPVDGSLLVLGFIGIALITGYAFRRQGGEEQ